MFRRQAWPDDHTVSISTKSLPCALALQLLAWRKPQRWLPRHS